MKIAIPTNNRTSISKRTGRAAEFAIYLIENGAVSSVKYEKNEHSHEDHERNEGRHREGTRDGHNHNHSHKHDYENDAHSHDEIISQLGSIDLLLIRAVGKYLKKDLDKGNIPYKLVKKESIKEIIADFL